MKKAFLTKIVTAVIAASTMTTLTPLGVSAETIDQSNYNYYGNLLQSYQNRMPKPANVGWVNNNGQWSFFDNKGAKQTGVINVNGQTYCLNQNGVMETGNVTVNNSTYTCSQNGQVVGTQTPTADKVFDANNNVVKNNNKTSTVTTSTGNNGTTTKNNTGSTKTNTGTTTNSGNTTGKNTASTNTSTSTGSTTNTSASTNSVDVQGLPKLPSNYSVSVQAAAEQKILDLMNQKRTEAGLKPLTIDNTLVQVARYKSNDMIQNNFFDHTNPDGTKWTNWLQTLGYKYTTTGENIAYNTSDANQLFDQWWNSPGHRANMMNSSYTKVGIGVVYGNGKYMGTQEFSN
ncbi:SCP-like extracellular [Clostridium sp. DL-VIII]|uniref:CAP domain-containing protein n=1 Tax=Clostridium sp. DL-VIII TaxID=641107 RepID=UPI00023B0257|nr:CAP domain-containing protein [Clostridium sp. DL-VIII]EHJ01179.1 SCP-like extracellular [Clostridium sp. DL-VIII]